MIATCTLLVGLLIGFALGRWSKADPQTRVDHLTEKLDTAGNDLDDAVKRNQP